MVTRLVTFLNQTINADGVCNQGEIHSFFVELAAICLRTFFTQKLVTILVILYEYCCFEVTYYVDCLVTIMLTDIVITKQKNYDSIQLLYFCSHFVFPMYPCCIASNRYVLKINVNQNYRIDQRYLRSSIFCN